ncbi:hypothetical protein N9B94_04610, partial [Verrucomicrobia bacterium]|nr:hypothetical protein [Verrucomicrobiota bacterium]
ATVKVSSVMVANNAGGSYTSFPTIDFSGGNPTSAAGAFTAKVSSVSIINGGSGYTVTPAVTISGGGGMGASGTATIRNGKVTRVSINAGTGYTSMPSINIAAAPQGGTNATASLAVAVDTITVTNGGAYTAMPTVSFTGTGTAATATVTVSVTAVTIGVTAGGSYTTVPTISFSGSGAGGAAGTLTLDVTGVEMTNNGAYTVLPTVTFGAATAPGVTATGTFKLTVTGVEMTNNGAYTVLPTVTFGNAPAGGVTATGTLTFRVRGVDITTIGAKYVTPPTVSFAAPTQGTGIVTATGVAGDPLVAGVRVPGVEGVDQSFDVFAGATAGKFKLTVKFNDMTALAPVLVTATTADILYNASAHDIQVALQTAIDAQVKPQDPVLSLIKLGRLDVAPTVLVVGGMGTEAFPWRITFANMGEITMANLTAVRSTAPIWVQAADIAAFAAPGAKGMSGFTHVIGSKKDDRIYGATKDARTIKQFNGTGYTLSDKKFLTITDAAGVENLSRGQAVLYTTTGGAGVPIKGLESGRVYFINVTVSGTTRKISFYSDPGLKTNVKLSLPDNRVTTDLHTLSEVFRYDGEDGDDLIVGSLNPNQANVLMGGDGKDVVVGGNGSDYIDGGDGEDAVYSDGSHGPLVTPTLNAMGKVTATTLTYGGAFFTGVPTVTFEGALKASPGTHATATAVMGLTSASFTIMGGTTKYTLAPDVDIGGGGGYGATATALLDSDGQVNRISITNIGTGYSTAPNITFQNGTVKTAGTDPTGTGNNKHFRLVSITFGPGGPGGSGYQSSPTVRVVNAGGGADASVDVVQGGSNGDGVFGHTGPDQVSGDSGGDQALIGGDGSDVVEGGKGKDTLLLVGRGAATDYDLFTGGGGDDTYLLKGDWGVVNVQETSSFGSGSDTIDLSGLSDNYVTILSNGSLYSTAGSYYESELLQARTSTGKEVPSKYSSELRLLNGSILKLGTPLGNLTKTKASSGNVLTQWGFAFNQTASGTSGALGNKAVPRRRPNRNPDPPLGCRPHHHSRSRATPWERRKRDRRRDLRRWNSVPPPRLPNPEEPPHRHRSHPRQDPGPRQERGPPTTEP